MADNAYDETPLLFGGTAGHFGGVQLLLGQNVRLVIAFQMGRRYGCS